MEQSLKYQPLKGNKPEADNVPTPRWVVDVVFNSLSPSGTFLDPCSGLGYKPFYEKAKECRAITHQEQMDLRDDPHKDFLTESFPPETVFDWIITNPPWSKARQFIDKGLEVANNVAYVITINHLFTKARIRLLEKHSAWISNILLLPPVDEFPPTGFQLGVIHLSKNHSGPTNIVHCTEGGELQSELFDQHESNVG
jgi:hypothetical protein